MLSPILDGYTVTATINIKPFAPIKFTYRPALPDKVNDFQASPRSTGKERTNAAIKLLTDNLLSWDVRLKPEEEPIACVESNWRRLPYPILDKLMDHITGYAAPEEDDPK